MSSVKEGCALSSLHVGIVEHVRLSTNLILSTHPGAVRIAARLLTFLNTEAG